MIASRGGIDTPKVRSLFKKSMKQFSREFSNVISGYDMSPFVRRYAKYLSEKSVSYMKVAFDFCKVKRGKDGGTIRKMNSEKLLKTLPILHEQESATQLISFG